MAFLMPLSAKQLAKAILIRWAILFIVLFISSFSFPHALLPDVGKLLSAGFEKPANWIAVHLLNIKQPFTTKLVSDATGMYVHVLFLLVVTAAIALLWKILDKNKKADKKLQYVLLIIIRYYLATQLLAYGCSKLFKWQFYLPEPNTLFTTVGNTSKDLLLWSTMGVSRLYTVFCGAVEVVAALLLLFRKTMLAGAIVAAGTLLNVFVINVSFDISVKLYSGFLLLLSLGIIVMYSRPLFYFFFTGKLVSNSSLQSAFTTSKRRMYIITKTAILLFLFADAVWPYMQDRNFNDDVAKRPLLHGAYNVETFIKNGDTLLPLLTDTVRWRRLFIHRRGFVITQYMNDDMQDYKLVYDTANHHLLLKKYDVEQGIIFAYQPQGKDRLLLSGQLNSDTIELVLQKIDLAALPALQQGFHWTIDSY